MLKSIFLSKNWKVIDQIKVSKSILWCINSLEIASAWDCCLQTAELKIMRLNDNKNKLDNLNFQ